MLLLKTLTPSVRNDCFEVWAIQPVPTSQPCSEWEMFQVWYVSDFSDLPYQWFVTHSVECLVNAAYMCAWERWGREREMERNGENCGTICIGSVPPMCTCTGHKRSAVCPALSPSIPFLTQGPLLTTLAASKPSQFSQQCWGYKPAWAHLDLHTKSELRSLRLCGKHSHSHLFGLKITAST